MFCFVAKTQLNPTEIINSCTAEAKADKIAKQGFDELLAKQGLYGPGVYLTPNFCNASRYCKLGRDSWECPTDPGATRFGLTGAVSWRGRMTCAPGHAHCRLRLICICFKQTRLLQQLASARIVCTACAIKIDVDASGTYSSSLPFSRRLMKGLCLCACAVIRHMEKSQQQLCFRQPSLLQ